MRRYPCTAFVSVPMGEQWKLWKLHVQTPGDFWPVAEYGVFLDSNVALAERRRIEQQEAAGFQLEEGR